MSRRQRCRSEAYRARRFIRRHPDLVAAAVEAASLSALASVVEPFIGRAAAERLVAAELAVPASIPCMIDPGDFGRLQRKVARLRPEMFRNVTGQTLESAGLDCLEYQAPDGTRSPLTGLAVRHGQTIEEALREELAKRGEGWSLYFVPPPAATAEVAP